MKMPLGEESALSKAAASLAIVALFSMALWGLSLYFIHGDGDTYPGGALGVSARIGLGGAAVSVIGLLVICLITFLRLAMRAFRQRGEQ